MEIIGSLFAILAGLAIAALLKMIDPPRKVAPEIAENGDLGDFPEPDEDRVHEIVKAAYLDLKRQRAVSHGPWLAALLDGGAGFFFTGTVDKWGRARAEQEWRRVEPAVALTAVRWTIRELLAAPVSYDKDGNEMPRRTFNLDVLRRAESELANMEEGA